MLIEWPAFIQHDNDAELVFLAGDADLQDASLHAVDYTDADQLVDSTGKVYSLSYKVQGKLVPVATERYLSLETVLGLVKGHAGQQGSCCVAKLYAPSIPEAMTILASMVD